MAEGKLIPFNRELDVRGKSCPLPIISAKKAMDTLSLGEILKVITSDQGSVNDFQAFARQSGADLLAWRQEAGEFFFYLKKVSP